MMATKSYKLKRVGILKWFRFSMLSLGIFLTANVFAQLPTANEIAGKMKMGWNLGNTFEATCGETAWGGSIYNTMINPKGVFVYWRDGFYVAVNYSSNNYTINIPGTAKILVGEKTRKPSGVCVWSE
jgi:hypothetical protein